MINPAQYVLDCYLFCLHLLPDPIYIVRQLCASNQYLTRKLMHCCVINKSLDIQQ